MFVAAARAVPAFDPRLPPLRIAVSRRTWTLSATLAACLLAPSAWAETPARLLVHPQALTLHGPQARHRLLVTFVGPDGRASDVTARATFVSSRPEVVAVDGNGECLARGDGEAVVQVRYEGHHGDATVTTGATATMRPPSFVNDVDAALHPPRLQPGRLPRQGGRAERLPPVAARLRPGAGPPLADARVRRPPHQHGRPRGQPAAAQAARPGPARGRQAVRAPAAGDYQRPPRLDPRRHARARARTTRRSTKLEVLPGNRTLQPGQTSSNCSSAPSTATARRRDVTWLSKFDSNDAGMAEVDAAGMVRVRRHGETAVRASFQGQVAVVIVTAPFEQPVDPRAPGRAQQLHRRARLQQAGRPAHRAVRPVRRRRVPPPRLPRHHRRAADAATRCGRSWPTRAPTSGRRLIDALLERPEFVDYWALYLGDLFQNRKERDHDVRGTKGVRAFHDWLRKQVAANRPWDELARDVLTASGKTHRQPGRRLLRRHRRRARARPTQSEVVASVAQAFLGTRIGCAQCHNHPLERYTQDDYYHFAAFFSRVKLRAARSRSRGRPTLLVAGAGRQAEQEARSASTQPRTGQFLKPQPLDRSRRDRRARRRPARPAGRLDDRPEERVLQRRDGQPPLAALPRRRPGRAGGRPAGQQPADQPGTVAGAEQGVRRPQVRPEAPDAADPELADLSAQLGDAAGQRDGHALLLALLRPPAAGRGAARRPQPERPACRTSSPATRRHPGGAAARPGAEVVLPDAVRPLRARDGLRLRAQRRSDACRSCCTCRTATSVVQKIRAGDGRLAKLLKRQEGRRRRSIEELFLATLSRPPTAAEQAAVAQALADGDDREEVFRDLFWALLNSKEFAFNH